jgi:hypothetical protein
MAFGGLGLSLAGFTGLISTLSKRPAADAVLAAYRTRTIVFLGFSLTFAGFGTVAAYGLLAPDVTAAVRIGTALMLIPFAHGLLVDTRPGPVWPDESQRRGTILVLIAMMAIAVGNLAVASVGYLQVVMLLGLVGPVTIFYNTIRDASREDSTATAMNKDQA